MDKRKKFMTFFLVQLGLTLILEIVLRLATIGNTNHGLIENGMLITFAMSVFFTAVISLISGRHRKAFGTLQNKEDVELIDKYFNSRQPESKNEKTGLFKGKNLIFITASEGLVVFEDRSWLSDRGKRWELIEKTDSDYYRYSNF